MTVSTRSYVLTTQFKGWYSERELHKLSNLIQPVQRTEPHGLP